MTEGTEIEDRVDFDDDNYIEETDDDVEEQHDSEGAGEDGKESSEDQQHELRSGDSPKDQDQLSEADKSDADTTTVQINDEEKTTEYEEKTTSSSDAIDKEKHAELLALPPRGSEIFLGGLPRDVSEEDLRELCESIGEIFQIRMIKNRDSGESKGFAFIAFHSKDVAKQAIEELHSKDFKGRTLRCSASETKNRLFIGNIPKSWTDVDFRKVIEETGPGAENIELIKDPQNPSRNRGFAFVEYYNNACADYSRQKMSNAKFKMDGNSPTVSWADPKNVPDPSAAAQVKAIYVKNIPESTSTEQLKELFQPHGEVTKVIMPPAKSGGKRDFGFIHFAERSSALKAVKDTEKYEIDGQLLEVCLAKPQAEKKPDMANSHSSGPHPNYIPHMGYNGFPGNPYASLGGGAGGGYGVGSGYQQQPMIYGRGPMPAGMQMVPMVLPDGRIGYVLQQPGAQMANPRPRRNERSNNNNNSSGSQGRGGTSGDRGGDDGDRNKRHRPY